MSLALEVGGMIYSNWIEATVERRLTAATGTFSFTAASDYKLPFPIPRGQAVTVLVNGKPVLTGFVDRISVSYDARGHSISIEGRDKTADIVDSKVDHKIEFKAPISLEEVARRTLSENGVTDVSVKNEVSGLEPFSEGDLISAHVGESLFEFIEKYARKRQVLVTTDGKGNLVLTRASTVNTDIQLNNVVGGTSNTIKAARVDYDDSDRFNTYKFYSQGNPSGDSAKTGTGKKLTNVTGEYIDSDVRASRKFHAIAESSSDIVTLEKRAKWEGQVRKAKSVKFTATVVGHGPTDGGDPYMVNTLVQVNDDFSDLRQQLLIIGVVSKLSSGGGSTTELELVSAESFALLNDKAERRTEKEYTRRASTDTKSGSKYGEYDNKTETYFKQDYLSTPKK